MRRLRRPRYGDGTVWLVVDQDKGDFLCYWYSGSGGDHLVDQAREPSAEEAIAWGHQRTPRVRIRTADARTYWAGTAPPPEGFAHRWSRTVGLNILSAPRTEAGTPLAGSGDDPAGPLPANPLPARDEQTRPPGWPGLVGVGPAPSGAKPC